MSFSKNFFPSAHIKKPEIRKSNFEIFSDMCVGIVTSVFEEQGVISVEVFESVNGREGFSIPCVRLGFPGYSFLDKSGIFYSPNIGDIAIVVLIKQTHYAISYLSLPIFGDVKEEETESKFYKEKINDFGDSKKILNFSAGRFKLSPGSSGILGKNGGNGVVVFPENSVEVFADVNCFRIYKGVTYKSSEISYIKDFCINFELSTAAKQLFSGINMRHSGEVTKTTTTDESFFCDQRRGEEQYYRIVTGHIFGKEDTLRIETVCIPEKNVDGTGNPETTDVEHTDGAGDISFSSEGNSKQVQSEKTSLSVSGRDHKPLFKRIVKKDGSCIESSLKKIEFQTNEDFNVFSKRDCNLLTDNDFFMESKKTATIVGLDKAMLKNKNYSFEIEEVVKIVSSSYKERTFSKEEGML